MAVLAALPFVVSCTAVTGSETGQADAGYVRDVCTRIMQVGPGGSTDFSACTRSLTATVRNRIEAEALSKSASDCRQSGLKDGSASFATCVLDRSATRGGTAFARSAIAEPAGLARGPFIESSLDERTLRQQYACAQLGLTPGSEDFTQCLVELGLSMDQLRYAPG
jgi:hypothetical protein